MYESICPICYQSVPTPELERHASSHFDDEELARDMELAQQIAVAPRSPPYTPAPAATSHQSSTSRCTERTSDGAESDSNEKICNLISSQIRATIYKVEAGLTMLLRKCLELDSENSVSVLSGYVDHFQSIDSEDAGWGCGWRNIQMLSSHLLMHRQDAREVLFGGSGFVPDIASLQRWLEIAWERGFDILGSSHFDHQIYGKKSWVGTTECAALFRSFGLRARIVDFDSKDNKQNSLCHGGSRINIYGPMDRYLSRGDADIPESSTDRQGKPSYSSICIRNDTETSIYSKSVSRSEKGQQILVDWVWNYFSDNRLTRWDNTCVIVSEKPPLYFQHDGHSRTIVGVQVKHQQKGIQQFNLLILDPAHKTAALERSLKEKVGWQKLIKRGVHTLRKPQYQLCYIDPGIAYEEEIEQLKTLDSTRIEF
ncbi:hypothetical protein NMG60_11020013 [Bertholletia excelsa]